MSFVFEVPNNVIFGCGVSEQVVEWAERLNGRSVMVVCDPGVKAAGIADPLLQKLITAFGAVCCFHEVTPDPDIALVNRMTEFAKAKKTDLLIAIGGGSAIDATKAVRVLLSEGGTITDYEGMDKITKTTVPMIAIPTTSGTGSEVTSFSIVSDRARKRNRLFDQVTRGITICGICVPTFWLGFLLLLFFAIHLKWFSVLPSPGWRGFLLPSFALAVPSSCSLIRIMRSSLLAELSSDYVRFAKARGLSANRILVCHILRNALPPVVTIFFQQFGFLIAGGAVIESVFSIKGIGTYLVDSVIAADTIAVSTCIVVIAAIFVVANFMADIINRLLCPWMVREENDT